MFFELEIFTHNNYLIYPLNMRPNWLYSLLLPLVLCILFAPVIFGGKTLIPADQLNTMFLPYSEKHDSVDVYNHFLTDAIAQVYPYKVRLRDAWLRGEFASWNPSMYGGHPHYASTSFTPFDATNVILLFGEMPTAYHWQMLVKLCIAGIAMWSFLGWFVVNGVRIHAALRALFAMAYMLNSLFITTLQHQWVLGVFCWMPLCVLFLLKFFAEKRILFACLSSLFLALGFLGGSLQTNAIAVLLLVIVGVSAGLTNASGTGQTKLTATLSSGAMLLGIGVLAFALTAFMWLPSLELFLYNFNVRAGGKPFSIVNGVKSIPLLVTFIIPQLLGTVRGFDLAKIAQADMNDFTAYIGFVPFWFAALGMLTLWRKMPAMRGFILLCGIGVLMPLFTPLYKFLYHRSFIIYVFGMTVIGAVAAQEIFFGKGEWITTEQVKRALRLAFIGLGIVTIGLVLGNFVLWWKYDVILQKLRAFVENSGSSSQLAGGSRTWMMARVDTFLAHYTLWRSPALLLALAIPLRALFSLTKVRDAERTPSQTTRTMALLLALTALQLVLFAHSWLPMIDTTKYPLYPPTQTTEYLRSDSTMFRFIPLFDAASQRVMQPNMNDMHGLTTSEGYESVFPTNISRISSAIFNPIPTHALELAGLINVKYYVSSAKNRLQHPALTLVDSGATLIYQNAYWKPRAHVSYSYKLVQANEKGKIIQQPSDSAYLAAYYDDTTFTGKTTLFWRKPTVAIQRTDNQQPVTAAIPYSVRFLNYENNRVRIEVESGEQGYLVLADTYYPGWRAFVNGEEQAIMRANYMMRSVVVPKGKSTVEFRFEPPLFRFGLWASVGAVLLCAIVVLIPFGRRTSSPFEG
jgi:hypothetical protein